MNDTPKIAGVLLIGTSLAVTHQQWLILAIATVMGIGGLLSARRVARVMSKEIAELNEGQGLAANLVTSFLVLGGSKFGFPFRRPMCPAALCLASAPAAGVDTLV